MTFRDYINDGPDTSNVAVLLEDAAAVSGVAIAGEFSSSIPIPFLFLPMDRCVAYIEAVDERVLFWFIFLMVISAFCVAMTHWTGNPMWDSLGSISVGEMTIYNVVRSDIDRDDRCYFGSHGHLLDPKE